MEETVAYIEQQSRCLAVALEQQERKNNITSQDIKHTISILSDFGIYITADDIPGSIQTVAQLQQWRKRIIDTYLERCVTIPFHEQEPIRQSKPRSQCGRPRNITTDQFIPCFSILEAAHFTMQAKQVICAELATSINTVNLLIREIRTGARYPNKRNTRNIQTVCYGANGR